MDNIGYIMKSFNMLNNNDYDFEKLPDIGLFSHEEETIKSNIKNIFRERQFINKTKEILSKEYVLEDILDKLLDLIKVNTNTSRIGVAYINYERQLIIAEHGAFDYGKVLLGPGFSVPIDRTSLKDMIKSKKGRITNNLLEELKKRPNSSSISLLVEEGIRSNLILPLIINNSVFGFLFFSSLKENNYNEKDLELGEKISQEIGGILNTTHLIKKMFITMTNAFANLVEKRDDETGEHISRMTEYSRLIAEELVFYNNLEYRVKQSLVSDITNYAAIHDIGKIGIPDSILKKPGKLNQAERKIMETHTSIGGDILRGIREDLDIFNRDFFKTALEITESHHERWDGEGYPKGLKGKEIPLAARIVAIADVFDALTSKRVYKDGFTFEDSVKIINEGCGSQFDPELVTVFNSILPEIKEVYENSRG